MHVTIIDYGVKLAKTYYKKILLKTHLHCTKKKHMHVSSVWNKARKQLCYCTKLTQISSLFF